jgi:hypothetical protein
LSDKFLEDSRNLVRTAFVLDLLEKAIKPVGKLLPDQQLKFKETLLAF